MPATIDEARAKAAIIKLIIFDVDGVMTDGRIIYSSSGEELKFFHVKDGLGIKLLIQAGIQTAIITGRNSTLVKKRSDELGIQNLIQGRDDKLNAMQELLSKLNVSKESTAYMGDDLPDLAAIQYAGLGISVNDAADYVKAQADFVTQSRGGQGAVREACEFILSSQNKLNTLIEHYDLKNSQL